MLRIVALALLGFILLGGLITVFVIMPAVEQRSYVTALNAEIHKLEPFDTNVVHSVSTNLQFVLETPQGWFEKNGVGTGTVITTRYGTLKETFFRRK